MCEIVKIIIIALIFNLLDFTSGIVKAAKTEGLKSCRMREGLYHKSAFLFVYAISICAMQGSKYLELPFVGNVVHIVCIYIVLTEIVSIIENICVINTSLSKIKLLQIFGVNKENENDENNKTD